MSGVDLGDFISPRGDDFIAQARLVHGERQDLQAAYPSSTGLDFRKWVATCGVLEYPERFARFFPPIPPRELRAVVCGGAEELTHLRSSIDDLEDLVHLLNVFAPQEFSRTRNVLDFGCGCGRLLRWFPAAFPEVAIRGCDVRAEAIEWCDSELAGQFFTNNHQPPLTLPDDSIDLVCALSVFSHLARASFLAWFEELVRVCSPGGVLFVSTLGPLALNVTTKSATHQSLFEMTPQEARDCLARLHREDFVHHEISEAWTKRLSVEAGYGNTFVTERHAREAFGPHAELVGFVPAGLSRFQDVYILKPKKQ